MQASANPLLTEATRDDADARPVAAGGWRRALLGLLVGFAAGAVVALLLPRDRRGGAVTASAGEPQG